MNKIAIIPARSGSKGLKDKNIINLCGKPLMAYSIEVAIKSNMFDRVIVSTDSAEYGKIAQSYGADVMYRDERLSDDKATTYMVIEDILNRLYINIDYFMLLQPTSPMRTDKHIIEACKKFESHYDEYDFLVSVKEAEHTAELVKPIEDDDSMKYFNIDYSNYRRQAYKEYSPNGAIFIGKPDKYLIRKHFFGENSIAYKMDKLDSIDIDDELDYEYAQVFMKKRLGEQ